MMSSTRDKFSPEIDILTAEQGFVLFRWGSLAENLFKMHWDLTFLLKNAGRILSKLSPKKLRGN